ncbi:DUF808 domain-containing protein [Parashewanella curva]|uniref:DUF808 domain-containing protein n=1 Tax=Parashewanella curva TaxID=2338552 RepID=A0A3L8PSY2_9GAMM|nr:DUF808 domain-containing protein [Parashewanella curva]RLV58530.1 DUF808 domain-containing protein [Parashewanella curva]
MAGASLLTLLDDIATILDDVSVMSKMAAKKTAGVLGDDLALNAEQVSGVASERELPVIWAVAKGSLKNKCILVPAALLISAFVPWLIMPLLLCGGLFLCFEGIESTHHKLTSKKSTTQDSSEPEFETDEERKAFETKKVKGAIRTDFVLSAEIIAITLGVVAQESLVTQASTLSIIALLMTIGVYGFVALIVRMDDGGAYLLQRHSQGKLGKSAKYMGLALLNTAPKLMKVLTIIGTLAMFLVGGGIVDHSLHILTYLNLTDFDWFILPHLLQLVIGVVAGLITVAVVTLFSKIKKQIWS